MTEFKVLMPKADPDMEEGTVVEWLKREGESVRKGEPLARLETQKVEYDLAAPVSGVIRRILARPGDTVRIAEPIAIVEVSE